jgi:hypothetical protein
MLPTDKNAVNYEAAYVDGIPVVWIQPDNQDGDARIVLWLPWLTGTKETAIPFLAELAGRGFTGVSFDLWQHGERGTESHLSHYAHAPAIAFECGADDTHVPPDGALRFRDALTKAYPHAATGVRVTLHPGTGHMESAQNPALFQNCLAWLAEDHTYP